MSPLFHGADPDLETKAGARIRELEEAVDSSEKVLKATIRDSEDWKQHAKALENYIDKAKAILEHVHSRTWYDDVKQALAALEGK